MSGIELNKIAAAVLLAGLIAMISGTVANVLYYGGIEPGEKEVKRGFQVEGAETADSGAGVPAADTPVDIAAYMGAADPVLGEKSAAKCISCHSFEKGGANKVGPNLYGVLGANHAHKSDFAYSDAMKAKQGEKWDYQHLSDFITHPQKIIPGTKMSFAGIKKPEERANLLAYLRTLSDSPLPLPPAPKPGAAPNGGAAPGGAGLAPATGNLPGKPGTGTEATTPVSPGAQAPNTNVKPGAGTPSPASPTGASGKAADAKKPVESGDAKDSQQRPAGFSRSGGPSGEKVEPGKTSATGSRAPGQAGE